MHMMDYLSIKVASKQVAEKSMSDAAARFRGTDKITHAGVSVDGTWQRKGSSLTLGVVTSISIDSGKVLDVVILSKSYKGCTSMKKLSLLISLVMRHGSHLIIVILIVPALPLEWKRQELLRSLVHQKRSMNYITPLFIETVTARNIVLSKTYGPTKLIKKFEFVVTIKNMTIAIIAQNLNLYIHRSSIKKINKRTPARSYMCHFLILTLGTDFFKVRRNLSLTFNA